VSGYPDLAAELAEVMDAFRLYRQAGLISPQLLRREIGRWRHRSRARLDLLSTAARTYLAAYTSRNEEYFYGILRRLERDARRQRSIEQRQSEIQQRAQVALEARLQQIILDAGPIPSAGSPGPPTCGSTASCVCSRGQLYYQIEGAFRLIPCPWCEPGLQRWRQALAADRAPPHPDWEEIKRQTLEALVRTGRVEAAG
jgi:hypothetical protein